MATESYKRLTNNNSINQMATATKTQFLEATESYKRLTGLKIGSKVRVTHKVASYKHGWPTPWDDRMDDSIGKVFTVIAQSMSDGDFQLDDSNRYWYPFFCLEVINDPDPVIKLESGDYNVVIKEGGAIEVGCQKISRKKLVEIYKASTARSK